MRSQKRSVSEIPSETLSEETQIRIWVNSNLANVDRYSDAKTGAVTSRPPNLALSLVHPEVRSRAKATLFRGGLDHDFSGRRRTYADRHNGRLLPILPDPGRGFAGHGTIAGQGRCVAGRGR
jgi:hypothetical protein